jgi:hypothetical protein
MPATTRAFVKASLLYLVLGAILGAMMLVHRYVPLGRAVAYLRVSHIEMLVVGWLTQLILGVAWWLFPPLQIGLRRDAPLPVRRGQTQRGSEPLFWVTFGLLNAGVLLRSIFEPLYSWSRIEWFRALAGSSGLFLLAAAVAFVLNMWGRVRELGKHRL